MRVDLISPAPIGAWKEDIWSWLNEFQSSNFDDYGPRSADEFVSLTASKSSLMTWGIELDGVPSGLIGFQPITSRLGMLNGVCFRKAAHRTGGPDLAFKRVLDALWGIGIEKVSATYFADNDHARRFLARHGAEDEGLMKSHTMRSGVPTDMRLVAIFRK